MSITIKRARGTVEFCVDLAKQVEWEAATDALKTAQVNPADRMVDTEATAAAKVVAETETAMADTILIFELEALPRKKWQEFEAAHPPREGVKEDENFSVNVSTFFDAVLPPMIFAVRSKSKNKPFDFDPATEWLPLADEMTEGQHNEFALKALRLNRGSTGVPFSRAASLLMAASGKS